MKPKIHIVTLGVQDLSAAVSFYRQMLELSEESISEGDDHVAFFLDGDMSLVLYPQAEIARITNQSATAPSSSQMILSHTAESREEVDWILMRAHSLGGSVLQVGLANEWGYSGYFQDPDGHVWEISSE